MNLIKSTLKYAACGALLTLFHGCASVICGPKQDMVIKTKPAGAEALIYDSRGEIIFQDKTPCIAALDRRTPDYDPANYVLLVRKEGYSPVQVPLNGSVNRA